MEKFLLALAAASLSLMASAAPWPYNEQADAAADVRHAVAAAQLDHKKVLLVFGAMHGSSQHLIESEFDVVKIDVGNFDKNLSLANRYGNPIAKGIPAVVVVGARNQGLHLTKGGELANVGQMTEQSIYGFLKQKVANRS